jgi:hypothetical protein
MKKHILALLIALIGVTVLHRFPSAGAPSSAAIRSNAKATPPEMVDGAANFKSKADLRAIRSVD